MKIVCKVQNKGKIWKLMRQKKSFKDKRVKLKNT